MSTVNTHLVLFWNILSSPLREEPLYPKQLLRYAKFPLVLQSRESTVTVLTFHLQYHVQLLPA